MGKNSLIKSNCCLIGAASDTPVIFFSGCLSFFTSPLVLGLVTAPKTSGILFVVFANAWAAGVVIPTYTLDCSSVSFVAIVRKLL